MRYSALELDDEVPIFILDFSALANEWNAELAAPQVAAPSPDANRP